MGLALRYFRINNYYFYEQKTDQMRMGHTAVTRGKRVMVMVRDGDNFVAKFKDKSATTIEFFDHDPIKTSEIRGITIYKAKQE